jgi:hypothetical protein
VSAASKEPRAIGERSAGYPHLDVDGDDVWVAWELRRGLAITRSRDLGTTFDPPSFIEGSADLRGGSNGSQQGKLMRKLAVRGDRIAVVNSALEHDVRSRVWLLQGTPR